MRLELDLMDGVAGRITAAETPMSSSVTRGTRCFTRQREMTAAVAN